jgi:hypothetical protein
MFTLPVIMNIIKYTRIVQAVHVVRKEGNKNNAEYFGGKTTLR